MSMIASVRRFDIRRVRECVGERTIDCVAVEEPLQIRVGYYFKFSQRAESFAVAMRTPGHDRELAAGLLLGEGVTRTRDDIVDIRQTGGADSNEIFVELAPSVDFEQWRMARNGIQGSSCGICGKRSIDDVRTASPVPPDDDTVWDGTALQQFANLLAGNQQAFEKTGGLHAAALIDSGGNLRCEFEDIGRHNALDKLTGHCFLTGRFPLARHLIFLSSRSSFELVQKCAMAGCSVLATIGGPSSLAIETARELGITLIGFVRPGRYNVYSGEWRLNS